MTAHRILKFTLFTLALTNAALLAQETRLPEGYRVDTLQLPQGEQIGVGGLAFTSQGALLISSREGQVWRYRDGEFSLFADGLHEALGLYVDQDTDEVWVMQRPELTKLIDEDDDGRVDIYQTVSDAWGLTNNYHEYTFGPVRDSEGNFYGSLNTSLSWRGWAGSHDWDIARVHDGKMGRARKYGGWFFQITPDGVFIPFASGMRSPAGIGINRNDELFYTDNQGDWNGSSTLQHVVKGRFHGHPSSLLDHPDFRDEDLNAISVETYKALRHPPAVYFVHGDLANSPGEPTFNETGGEFGPWFENQIFVGDQTKSVMMRIDLEKVQGDYQGSVYPFARPLRSGIVRNVFGPDGTLWIGQTGRGWRSVGADIFGIQTIQWDGETTPFEIQSIRLTPTGFKIRWTRPVNKEVAGSPDAYLINSWEYLYRPEYGSPKHDRKVAPLTRVSVADDGAEVHLDLPLETGRVYEFQLNVPSKDGAECVNPIGWYTLNNTL